MNIEEKIKKKQNRKRFLKKAILPVICTAIILTIIITIICFILIKEKNNNKNQTRDTNTQEQETKIDENQILGIKIEENKILYKEYTYTYTTDLGLNISRQKENEELQEVITDTKSGSSYENINIYKDKIYVLMGSKLKTFNLDGSGEQVIVEECDDLIYDFDKELIYYIYHEYSENKYEMRIQKLTGEMVKVIPIERKGYLQILGEDEQNIYFSDKIDAMEYSFNAITTVILYSFNKESNIITKIKTEEIHPGSSDGIFQIESYGEYVYYIIGSQQGTAIMFDGKACRIKKDGTQYEEITDFSEGTGFGLGTVPKIVIKNNYLYVEGYRINLANNQKTVDKYKNGDKIDDDDYVYTASVSDSKSIVIAKYKAGTQYEEIKTIFSKEMGESEAIDTDKIQIEIQGDYIYISIDYLDYNTENWRPVVTNSETYRIKKDGSFLEKIS